MARRELQQQALGDVGGILAGYRNKIINGDFEVAQRGTSFASPAVGAYTLDRWYVHYDGTGATRTISRQTHTLGQTDVPGNPAFYARFAQSVAGSGASWNVLDQRIEDVRALSGKKVTLTFYCKFGSTASIGVSLWQNFGTGGSPSTNVQTNVFGSVSVGTTWQKVQKVVTLPSIAGKTLGSNGDSSVQLEIALPINTTFTFDISHVSVVEGDATQEDDPFSPRHIQQELALCQRYYWRDKATGAGYGMKYSANTGGFFEGPYIVFPVPMRTVPSMAIVTAPTYDNSTSYSLTVTSATSAMHRLNVLAAGIYRAYDGVYEASAEL